MNVPYTQLNPGQQLAVDKIFSFLASPYKAFRLSGPPGTGKTFTIQHIADQLLDLYKKSCLALGIEPVDYKIEITATTNKAAEVLAESLGRPVQTIHSFMNLTVYDDYQSGETKVRPTKRWGVHKKTLLFVDEASMIDAALYSYIDKGLDSSCKVIFVGDPHQLPPVFEPLSRVYAEAKPEAVLDVPVRNAGQQALVDLCAQLRQTVETGVFQPIQEVPGVIDYLSPAEAFAFVDQEFSGPDPSARILCFRNARVKEFNEYIRNLRGHPDKFVRGETVISNTVLHDPENKVLFRTDQSVYIEDADHTERLTVIDNTTQTEISTYTVWAAPRRGANTIRVQVPTDPDHVQTLMKWFKASSNWPPYFRLRNQFPDFRQRDASTVYKAQGSTFETVLLDLNDLGKCKKSDQLARMLYVGASRPTTRLCLYGRLPDRLF